jgi:hypothetical protein
MSARRRIVVRTIDDDPEKKHRAARQVRLWVWIAVMLAVPPLGYALYITRDDSWRSSSSAVRIVYTAAPPAQVKRAVDWAAGREETLSLTSARPRMLRWSVCAVPSQATDLEARQRHANALSSWLAAGARSVVLLSLRTAAAPRRRGSGEVEESDRVERLAELEGEDGVPVLSSALAACDKAGGSDVTVLVHPDVMLLPSFGARLQLVAEQFRSSSFLVAGPRVTVRGTAADARRTLERGEAAIRREWLLAADRRNSASVDLIAWRRGVWRDANVPNLLLDSSTGWEGWLWAHAKRANWAAVDGGNVLFGLHPFHSRSAGPALAQRNADRVREWLKRGGEESGSCDTPRCASFLVHAGKCRNVGEEDEKREERICLRRKDGEDDRKVVLADRF